MCAMPELPEVETVRRGLEPRVTGRRINSIEIREPRLLRLSPLTDLTLLSGQTIHGLKRRGKYLVFVLERHYLIFHLGMTGQLTVHDLASWDAKRSNDCRLMDAEAPPQHPPDPHTHAHLLLDGGVAVLFRDVRKFGRVFLVGGEASSLPEFFERRGLGLEPFTEDYNLAAFLARLSARNLKLKSLLLDQAFVAGVGNIYADEALFEAGLHPERKVDSLHRVDKERLFKAVRVVLERGIAFGGTSLRDYVNCEGAPGRNQEELYVYGRTGEPCLRCSEPIRKILVSQRGTHFCPACQPRSPRSASRRRREGQPAINP
jgi:formamidopyrimidine-DNA glycosylase